MLTRSNMKIEITVSINNETPLPRVIVVDDLAFESIDWSVHVNDMILSASKKYNNEFELTKE
jgi:hypothetical protein